jgi:hypothetical protein
MVDNFSYHEVTEKEQEEIKKNAKKLMDGFSEKLTSVKGEREHFGSSVSKGGCREEGEPWNTLEEFRSITFSNAPFVEDEHVVAEKAAWKK